MPSSGRLQTLARPTSRSPRVSVARSRLLSRERSSASVGAAHDRSDVGPDYDVVTVAQLIDPVTPDRVEIPTAQVPAPIAAVNHARETVDDASSPGVTYRLVPEELAQTVGIRREVVRIVRGP